MNPRTSAPRAKRRARMRELSVVHRQQDLFDASASPPPCPAAPDPEVLIARAAELRSQAQRHAWLQREHARNATVLLAEAARLEQAALQLALPLAIAPAPVLEIPED